MKKTNLKILLTAAAVMLLSNGAINAQVTVGANTIPKATLDVVAANPNGQTVEGIIAPRLTGNQIQSRNALYGAAQEGVVIYATSAVTNPTVGDKTEKITAAGYYYFDGTVWQLFSTGLKWFYMPSIVIDVQTSGMFHRNLYLEYKKQFADIDDGLTPSDSPIAGTKLIKSDGAANFFTKIYPPEELYYYVTGYDATVFSDISLTTTGVLTYTVNADNVSDATFMNIVFMIK